MMETSSTKSADIERQALLALRKLRKRLDEIEDGAPRADRHCRPGLPISWRGWSRSILECSCKWSRCGHADPRQTMEFRSSLSVATPRCFSMPACSTTWNISTPIFLVLPAVRLCCWIRSSGSFSRSSGRRSNNAGIPATSLRGSDTGVFVGMTTTDYLRVITRRMRTAELDAYVAPGNTLNGAAGRVSYLLGLHGPCIAMDTACSSSLVAIDRACRSLRDDECRLAIAAGVNLLLAPEFLASLSRWGMLAADGRCKTFDASANGFVRAEGCGVVLLKRLSHARADGDRIWALVRGSAVNQDGASSGLTVPNGLAQAAVLRAAIAKAGVEPRSVSYVEAHWHWDHTWRPDRNGGANGGLRRRPRPQPRALGRGGQDQSRSPRSGVWYRGRHQDGARAAAPANSTQCALCKSDAAYSLGQNCGSDSHQVGRVGASGRQTARWHQCFRLQRDQRACRA